MDSTRTRSPATTPRPERPAATPRHEPAPAAATVALPRRDRWLESLRFDFKF